ncbi:hypothetical protein C5E10_09250 [Pseudoclavibacter sp. RFBG4]|uniref:hypothetical protein n=1 Tax=Pseudoclavibacter sp. RFBG4 TaxID=2080575 RepID=UPI000CE74A0F|nr:hypothetical protein [Pseudoclavibacter sp. RFBG4]PPG33969.1 hypothetical protein C5E10_09250 [Pseudoclavibacter sp. RFBG4]
MSTFAPSTDRVANTSWGSSRQGAAVVGLWIHHQADGAGADANDYMIGPNDRDSHPTYAIDDNESATVVGIVHPNKAPSSTFYVNDQSAVALEAANTTGEPEWRVPEQALEEIALIAAHHAIESPRAAHPIEVNQPGVTQRGFWVGWHSQVRSTACPGPYLTARIPAIVARANQIKNAIQAGASWSDILNNPAAPDKKAGFLMALNDSQQEEIYQTVKAIRGGQVHPQGYTYDAAILGLVQGLYSAIGNVKVGDVKVNVDDLAKQLREGLGKEVAAELAKRLAA